jgi:hypothetical protein
MKYSLLRLPWEKLEKGQGFFIPCLDTEAMREWGLKQAFFQRILDAHASVGILDGKIGVMFIRRQAAPPQHVTAE